MLRKPVVFGSCNIFNLQNFAISNSKNFLTGQWHTNNNKAKQGTGDWKSKKLILIYLCVLGTGCKILRPPKLYT